MKPDPFDTALIDALKENARQSNREVARRLGVPENRVRTRLKQLQTANVVRLGLVRDTASMGLRMVACLRFSVSGHRVRAAAEYLASQDSITFVALTAGEFNLICVYLGESEQNLWDFLNDSWYIDYDIERTNVVRMLRATKHRYDLVVIPQRLDDSTRTL